MNPSSERDAASDGSRDASRAAGCDAARATSHATERGTSRVDERGASRDEAREAWRRARTFDDLCRLGEAFVRGENAFFPGWGWHVLDEESDRVAPHLALLQRAGFLTLASQPGCAAFPDHDGAPHEQRAFVCGFASDEAARTLAALRAEPELAIALFRRGESGDTRIPVSSRGGVAHAFAGYSAFEEELECFVDHLSHEALRALEGSTYVSAIDLVWGRESKLWSSLSQALGPK